MLKKKFLFTLAITTFLISTKSGISDDIKGYMIHEYYFAGSHHSGDDIENAIEGQHGFWHLCF